MAIRTQTLGLVAVGLLAACAGGGGERDRAPAAAEPAVKVSSSSDDAVEGVPQFAWLHASAQARPSAQKLTAEDAAWKTLRAIAPAYRLDARTLATAELRQVHDAGDGPIVAQFVQRVAGLEVFQRRMRLALTRDLQPVAASGHLASAAGPRAGARFVLDAAGAGRAALAALTGLAAARASVTDLGPQGAGYDALDVAGLASARAKKLWFAGEKGLVPAFYVELDTGEVATSFVISAEDGAVLFRKELTQSHSYRVWADPETLRPMWGPQDNAASPHPTGRPDGFQATYVPRALITLDNVPFSRNDPWLPPGATETAGNNVTAYADLTRPNGFGQGDLRPTADDGKFDFAFDTSRGPQVNDDAKKAVTTQLFYAMNYLHDVFYDAGFDEASGNHQADNFGRGGAGNDRLVAEAQDYSGRNNANASTPADGASPRIQMYVFDGEGNAKVQTSAGAYEASPASFAPATFRLSAQLALVEDGQGTSTDGCEPATNAAALAGRIALVDRGQCNFVQKVANVTAAGAIGVVIANNTGSSPPGIGSAQGTATTIPTLGVSMADGAAMKATLAAGTPLTVTLDRAETIDRDGSLDLAIVTHEWGHVLSNRLVGDANGLSNTQGVGMGEGWGDFTSLLALTGPDPRKQYEGAYAVGGYTMSGGTNNGYYYGVRRYPYSIDKTRNPLTYQHIQNGARLPTTAPAGFGEDGADNAEVHNTGEIWGAMLWECYVALLRDERYTFDQANLKMRKYLVASLKLTPSAPTMLEARDAVLAAAYATDAKDFELFAAAFARRGAGTGAVGPDRRSTSNVGVKESFVSGNDVAFVSGKLDDSAASCDKDGVLDVGEKGTLTIAVKNTGTGTLTQTKGKVTSPDPAVQLENGGIVTFPASKPYETVTAKIGVVLATAKPVGLTQLEVAVEDPSLAVPRTVTGKLEEFVHYDVKAKGSATDDVEAPVSEWKTGGVKTLATSDPWRRERQGAGHVWTISNIDTISDQWLLSPPLEVAADGKFGLKLKHKWSFEVSQGKYFDGGVIEISDDKGATWKDIGAAAKPGYGGKLETEQSDNPLKGRDAFVGRSAGYPAMLETDLDLGVAYAGKTVQVRFRVGTDEGTGADGWTVDDLAFRGIVGTPFGTRVADNCGKAVDPTEPPGADPNNPGPTGGSVDTPAEPGAKGDSGCGCRVAGDRDATRGSLGLAAMMGALGAAFARRRRKPAR